VVVCLGEVLIDFVAADADRPLEVATTFIRAAGGAPANVAVGLVRLGSRAAFVGKIAQDAFGQSLREALTAEGVDVRGLVSDAAARTPLVFVGPDGTGGRRFIFYHDGMADTLLRPDELAAGRELIAHAAAFHFGSVTLAAEPGARATLEAVRWARRCGCLVSFDPNVRLEVWRSEHQALEAILECLQLVDLVKVSADEVQFLTGTADVPEACRRLRSHGPTLAVATLGGDGCYFDAGACSGSVAGVSVPSVDALGAGDAFMAGLLACTTARPGRRVLEDEQALVAGLRFANAVGAITTTRYGAIPALPTRSEVERLVSGVWGESARAL
jgi:fructokinase